MSSHSNQTSLKQSLSLKVFYVSMQLEKVARRILTDIRHAGFGVLRKGVITVTLSFTSWAERQVI